MKKREVIFLSLIIILILLLGFYTFYEKDKNFDGEKITGYALDPSDSSRVERGFSVSCVQKKSSLTVTLFVVLDPSYSHKAFAIEEQIPFGWNITDSGSAIQDGNLLKWSEINDGESIESQTFNYQVQAPNLEGTYSFSGDYIIDGMNSSSLIGGSKSIEVKEDCAENLVDSSRVERGFSAESISKEDSLTVTLFVVIDSSYPHNALAIEEQIPFGWNITNKGSAIQDGNLLKWSEINDGESIESQTFNYQVQAPNLEGTYSFSGDYIIDGMNSSSLIGGSKSIEVKDYSSAGEESGGGSGGISDSDEEISDSNKETTLPLPEGEGGSTRPDIETGSDSEKNDSKLEEFKNLTKDTFGFIVLTVLFLLIISIGIIVWFYYKKNFESKDYFK